jgi:penicillin-binding protein 2
MLVFDQIKRSDPHLRLISLLVLTGLLVLLTGLWYVQVIASSRYVDSQVAQSFRSVRIPAVRGMIIDRNGLPLAANEPNYNLCLFLEELSKQFQAVFYQDYTNLQAGARAQKRSVTRDERTLLGQQARYKVASNTVRHAALAMDLPLSLGLRQFQQHYQDRLALPLPVLQNLTATQLARFYEQPGMPPSMDVEVLPKRVYYHGPIAAHILGYLSRDDRPVDGEDSFFNYLMPDFKGVVGIEAAFEEQLRGMAGYKFVLVNSLGYRQSESVWTPAAPGKNVMLTLDLPLQKEAEKALASAQARVQGAVVVMDIRNGDLLAMVSQPAFDPNSFVPAIDRATMLRLNDLEDRPLINRACQERYAPGSIFKIATALACLEAGTLNPEEKFTVQPDPKRPGRGCIYVGNRKIEDTAPPGEYNFKDAFKLSSNSYFIHHGLLAGLSRLLNMGAQFQFGQPLEIPTQQSDRGIFPDQDRLRDLIIRGTPWTDGDTANLCIGQGMLAVNPVQMAVMVSAVANGGKVFWPRLVKQIEPMEPGHLGRGVVSFETRPRGELRVKPQNLRYVREAMLADVIDRDGTGHAANVPGYQVAGKTGTAEVQHGGRTVDKITWFASFAPFDNPQYAVIVMVESGGSGGGTCAPVAGRIYRAVLEMEKRKKGRVDTLALR